MKFYFGFIKESFRRYIGCFSGTYGEVIIRLLLNFAAPRIE